MQVTYTIDWLSVTSEKPHYSEEMTMYFIERERGSKGYTVVIEFEDGRLEMLNPDRPEMGVHVEYSGSTLETIERDYGIPKMDILALGANEIKTSRLDIAIDAMDTGLRVSDLVAIARDGGLRTSAKKYFEIKSVGEKGHTFYIGAPSSQARLRIYDKAAEQGIAGDWIRIELQLRSSKARAARQAMLSASDRSLAASGIINQFASFDCTRWRQIMTEEITPAQPGEKHDGATEKWLLTTVAKSLAKLVAKKDGSEFWTAFCQSVDGYRDEQADKRRCFQLDI